MFAYSAGGAVPTLGGKQHPGQTDSSKEIKNVNLFEFQASYDKPGTVPVRRSTISPVQEAREEG